MVQLAVTKAPVALQNGTLQGTGPHKIKGFTVEEATGIPLGVAVVRGTNKVTQGEIPAALFDANLDFLGFAILPNHLEKDYNTPTTDVVYKLETRASACSKGISPIAVVCGSAFVAGTVCQVVCIAAGAVAAETVGALSATIDAVNAQPISAVFENSGAAGEVAEIQFF